MLLAGYVRRVPRLDLDPSTFDACAEAVRGAGESLRPASGLRVATGATGSSRIEAALEDLGRAWATDMRLLGEQLDAVAAALAAAGRTFAAAEGDAVATLTGALRSDR